MVEIPQFGEVGDTIKPQLRTASGSAAPLSPPQAV